MENYKNKQISIWIRLIVAFLFLISEAVLLTLIVIFKIPNTKYYCYLSVLLCFIIASIFVRTNKYNYIILIALFFTLMADLFLVLIEKEIYKLPAMCIFLFAQISYAIYITIQLSKAKIFVFTLFRIGLMILLVFIIWIVLKNKIDLLSIISICYFINLVINFISICFVFKNNFFLTLGLLLFILCDITTGLIVGQGTYFNLRVGSLLYQYINLPINLIWLLYIPSQTLISLSVVFKKKYRKEKDNVSKEVSTIT